MEAIARVAEMEGVSSGEALAATALQPRTHKRLAQGEAHLRVLPPSANWFCSKICDCALDAHFGLLLAFGAKNNVFIYQVAERAEQSNDRSEASEPSKCVELSFFAQLVRGKRDRRVTSVQFLTDPTGELRLVCGGEDGGVQIWDVASLTMLEHHRKHKVEVTAVAVSSRLDVNFVVAGDRQGRLSAWQRDTGKVALFTPLSGDGVHSLAIAPHDKTLVAIGFRSGVLCLVDAAQGIIRHRLDGHDQEIQCLAWKAAQNHQVWLASSSRDKTIKVWQVNSTSSTKPTLDQTFRLPTGKQGMSFSQAKQLWLPVAWSDYGSDAQDPTGNHRLWSGSFDGSLLLWEWNASKTSNEMMKKTNGGGQKRHAVCKPIVVKGGHNRMLFSIVMVPLRRTGAATMDVNADSVSQGAVSMLTVSLDRELRLWKEGPAHSPRIAPATCVEKLGGLGGHAYSVAYNATSSVVAAGIGDQTIRLWQLGADLSCGETTTSVSSDYRCELLWRGLQSKVTCVQWHPLEKTTLGYGTEDGCIGIYDTQSMKHTRFRSHHTHEVQQLQWRVVRPQATTDADSDAISFIGAMQKLEAAQEQGQSLEEALADQNGHEGKQRGGNDLKVLLWSRGMDGSVLESNAEAPDDQSREMELNCSSCAWDEGCELVAIGKANGSVEVLKWDDNDMQGHGAAVARFHEHLEAVTCLSWGQGENVDLLASGGQDGKIFIYKYGTNNAMVASFASHSSKITGLQWCPGDGKRVVASCSADRTVQVWNVSSKQRMAPFMFHVGRVLTLAWISPHMLITGGEDQTLRIWDYRSQLNNPTTSSEKRPKAKQPQTVEIQANYAPESAATPQIKETDVSKEHSALDGTSNAKKPSNNKPRKKKTLLFHPESPLTPEQIARACRDAVGATHSRSRETTTSTTDAAVNGTIHSLVQSSPGALSDFFGAEEDMFRRSQGWEDLAHVLLLQGKVSEALRVVAKEGALTPTWLAYAPMAGMDVWRELTNVYAHQLDAQGDKKGAAFHFLSISKVRATIACLVSGDAYNEALALIRTRLGPHDPLLHDTLWKYAEFLDRHDRHGEAALVLLQFDSTQAKLKAVHALVAVGDMASIEAALDVLLAAVQASASVVEGQAEETALSLPASFFLSIASRALIASNFAVADKAGQLLQSRVAAASAPNSVVLYRLLRCLLGITKALDERRRCHSDTKTVDEGVTIALLRGEAPESVCDLFSCLMNSKKSEVSDDTGRLYQRVGSGISGDAGNLDSAFQLMKTRADGFWAEVLRVCRASDLWFDAGSDAYVQEAQDLLVEPNCFSDLTKMLVVDAGEKKEESTSTVTALLHVAECLVRLMVDVFSLSFVSALEHLHEVFTLDAQTKSSSDLQTDVMTLLLPCGFVSSLEPPRCGELAEEEQDARFLWSSVLLSQCTIVLSTALGDATTEEKILVLDVLLRLLRREFHVDSDTKPSLVTLLKGTASQERLQKLLDEMLVATYELPGGSDTRNENKDAEVQGTGVEQTQGDASCKAERQALIDEVNALRARLTLGEGSDPDSIVVPAF